MKLEVSTGVSTVSGPRTNELVPEEGFSVHGESLLWRWDGGCAALVEGMFASTRGVSSEKKSGERARRGRMTGIMRLVGGMQPCPWKEHMLPSTS